MMPPFGESMNYIKARVASPSVNEFLYYKSEK